MFARFQCFRSCSSFVKLIPKHFILFDAIVHGIFSFISFLDCLFLVYGNTIEFCIVILYCAALITLFITSHGVFMDLWGFST